MTTIVSNSRTDRKETSHPLGNVERGADEFVGTPHATGCGRLPVRTRR